MPKYRLLTRTELESLEREFVEYLVVNGITADDWQSLKTTKPEEAARITDLFSDVVFESVLKKAEHLIFRGKTYLQLVRCGVEQMEMIAFSDKSGQTDFTKKDIFQKKEDLTSTEVFTGSKTYKETREKEIFTLTEKGYEITGNELFKRFEYLLQNR